MSKAKRTTATVPICRLTGGRLPPYPGSVIKLPGRGSVDEPLMQRLDKLMEDAEAEARAAYEADPMAELPVVFYAVTRSGEEYVHHPQFANRAEEVRASGALRLIFRMLGVAGYVQRAEGWTALRPAGPSENLAEAPDRIEVLTIMASDGVTGWGRVFQINRGPDGGVCGLQLVGDAALGDGPGLVEPRH